MGRGPGSGSPAQRGVSETNLPAWRQLLALKSGWNPRWRSLGLQGNKAHHEGDN